MTDRVHEADPATVRRSSARRQAVRRILESPRFAQAPVSRQVLETLHAAHAAGQTLSQYALSEALYGSTDAADVERTRRAVGECRKRLALAQAEGERGAVRVVIPSGRYGLEFLDDAHVEDSGTGGRAPAARRTPVALACLLLLGVASVVAAWAVSRRAGPPHSVRVTGSRLQVLDAAGELIAERDFGEPLQHRREYDDGGRNFLRADLDGDGALDLLFTTEGSTRAERSAIHLFDGATRRWRWSVPLRRTVPGARRSWSPSYLATGVMLLRDEEDRPWRILTTAAHQDSSLSFLLVTDLDGREISTFWAHGHLGTRGLIVEMDLTGDGRREVIVPLRHDHEPEMRPALVVFDREHISGFAPHPAGFDYFPADASGEQLAYVLLPRTDVTQLPLKNYVTFMQALDGGLLEVHVHERVFRDREVGPVRYQLDARLYPVAIEAYDGFHHERHQVVEPGAPRGQAYLDSLRSRFRYHDGRGWSDVPPTWPRPGG